METCYFFVFRSYNSIGEYMRKWVIFGCIGTFLIFGVSIYLYIKMVPVIKEYGDMEIHRFNQMIVSHSYFTKESLYDDLVVIERDDHQTIELLDFDMIKMNQLANEIVTDLEKTYASIETKSYKAKEQTYYQQRLEAVSQDGIVSYIPVSSFMKIPLPSFFKIKIRMNYEHLSSVGSSIEKSIQNYGVNHVMVELNIIVHIKLVMTYPFFEEYHVQNIKIPVLLEIFQGQVPIIYNR